LTLGEKQSGHETTLSVDVRIIIEHQNLTQLFPRKINEGHPSPLKNKRLQLSLDMELDYYYYSDKHSAIAQN